MRVSFESLYGINFSQLASFIITYTKEYEYLQQKMQEHYLLLTRPKADSELLIILASCNVSPEAPVLLTLIIYLW